MYHIMLKGCYSGVAWRLALLREKRQKKDGWFNNVAQLILPFPLIWAHIKGVPSVLWQFQHSFYLHNSSLKLLQILGAGGVKIHSYTITFNSLHHFSTRKKLLKQHCSLRASWTLKISVSKFPKAYFPFLPISGLNRSEMKSIKERLFCGSFFCWCYDPICALELKLDVTHSRKFDQYAIYSQTHSRKEETGTKSNLYRRKKITCSGTRTLLIFTIKHTRCKTGTENKTQWCRSLPWPPVNKCLNNTILRKLT